MRSKTSAGDKDQSLLSQVYERGEDAISQLLDELLGAKNVAARAGRTAGRAAEVRKHLDRNMGLLLSLFNLPSRSDYNKLLAKIDALEGTLVNTNMKLDRLLATQTDGTAREQKAQRKPKRRRSSKRQ